ncbi:hypothetical protein Y032_0691g1574 [Ancylostoma ceylanicum]|uniref:Uncharacterized protein n=1 Tax=Ancylostoma ceylanicum TaxID=53326 RepID=A0A016WGV6_9BILA|nr:hypothetical protein Y032_0691g1574 [Ancylostoma ceylanicum]
MKNKHANPEVLRLGSEVRRLRSELSLISPTAEFSTYFKTERILNKAVEQYDAAVAKEKMMQPSQVKVEMGVKVVAQAIGLYLLHTVSGIHATKARTYNAMGNAFVITSNFPPIEVNVHTDICRHCLQAFCIPSSIFWPFNFLLRFPSVWSDEGCIPSVPNHTPVSMFVLVYCGIVAGRSLLSSKMT